ncbi:MAG TPA: galactokinase [Trichormus sp.]|jgi:galactokinase
MSQQEDLIDAFQKRFQIKPLLVVRAPGRVNLIGEHTDYNEGFVFPAAIDRWMSIAAHPSTASDAIRIHSMDYDEDDSFTLSKIEKSDKPWSNYLRGVLEILKEAGHRLQPFDAVLSGNVPQGAGLSSSAAYEVAVAVLQNSIGNLGIDGTTIALLSQKAENLFIGVRCGIMDQFISALGEPDSALLIDCRSLEYRPVKLNLQKHNLSIVITNSGVRRGLVDSEYNQRRDECEQGVTAIGIKLNRPTHSLRDITFDELNAHKEVLSATVLKRCRHVISENLRVLDAVSALENGQLARFGQLMNESHVSLRDDYEVSCAELDLLVDLTQQHPGTLGARMTGAGFGGCTVAIMDTAQIDPFVAQVIPQYQKQTGKSATVYVCNAVAGASTSSATMSV